MDEVKDVVLLAGFSDLHLNLDEPAVSVGFPGPQRLDGDYANAVKCLCEVVREEAAKNEDVSRCFMIQFGSLFFRTQLMRAGRGAARYALRAISDLKDFSELGLKEVVQKSMLSPELHQKGGLVLIGGTAGSGKTTTASSYSVQLLKNFGGYCLTAEDPPEYRMEGFHGNGYLEQTEISADPHQHLREMLRCFPSSSRAILLYGEVRDSRSAAELLRIALDGHLVVSTVHGASVLDTLERVLTLASKDGEVEARTLLAASLRLVVQQNLTEDKVLQSSAFEITGQEAAIIRTGKLIGLRDAINQAERRASSRGLSL